jgi:hypothetical protein
MIKTLVAAGCSFTKDYYQKTWPDYLSNSLRYNLVNIGARGAGMDFISKRLITHLTQCDPDTTLVGIMLPSSDRFDYYVDSSHPLKNNLLNVTNWQGNGRPELINLDGTTSYTNGYSLTGGEPRGDKKYWYKYFYNKTYSLINYWFNVHSIQTYLKLQKFDYFFTTAYDIDCTVEQPINNSDESIEYTKMFDLIDFDQFIFYKERSGFLSFVKEKNFTITDNHPDTVAHSEFVKSVLLNV